MTSTKTPAKRNKVHDFNKSFGEGKKAEDIVQAWLESENWTVRHVPQPRLKEHGDFYIFHPDHCNDKELKVEVKSDAMAEKTKNFFIEVGVNYYNKDYEDEGWARYSVADYVYFYFPRANSIWIVPMHKIQSRLDGWLDRYKIVPSYNKSWEGRGVLVPALEIQSLRDRKIKL